MPSSRATAPGSATREKVLVMTGQSDVPATIDGPQYPMVDLFTGGTILPLMFVNAAATCYLLSLTAPLAFMEAWTKVLEVSRPPPPSR